MTRHEELFVAYTKDLLDAKEFAERWWSELLERESLELGEERADQRLRRRWPAGSASHPRVLGVIRHYWLACEALNQQIEREEGSEQDKPSIGDYGIAPEPDEHEEERSEDEEDDEGEELAEEEEVYPQVFVQEWLMDNEHDELALYLSSLTYWPVGLDANDNYV